MKYLSLLVLGLGLSLSAMAAGNLTLQSKVLDSATQGGIELCTVRLLAAKDSSFVGGATTDQFGSFSIGKLSPGRYILEVKYLGYKDLYQNVEMKNSLVLKNILLEEMTQDLGAVTVSGMAAQMIVKGDTVEFNATAFKTAENAVVEDLLKRMPGFEVNDGQIKVNGETISRIKVNGKKFFDGDIEMTTKNLTADMVEKIQVIDEKSDMAKLTGFEDDETERIINITLKRNRQSGIFGNIGGGLGADLAQIGANSTENGIGSYFKPDYDWSQFLAKDARYNANGMVNFMMGDTQTALIAGANNANNSRSGRGRAMRGWGGNSNGITSTQNIGVNNSTVVNDKLALGGDLSYNHSSNLSENESTRDSWLAKDTLTNNNESRSVSGSHNANLRFEAEWKIDSLNTLIIQPNVSYSDNRTDSRSNYDYYTNGDSTSWGDSYNMSHSTSLDSRLNLIFNHRSNRRAGRTLTLNVNGSYGSSNSQGENLSHKNTRDTTVVVDQHSQNLSDNYAAGLRASWVEPLWNLKNFVEISASFNYRNRTSEKLQYDQDAYGDYTVLDAEYSNDYRNISYSEVVEANYRYNNGMLNLMAGMRFQPSQNYSYTTYRDGSQPYNTAQEVFNFSPTLSIRYNLGDRRNYLRMEYRGNSQQPSISQMQPVKNNSNLMNETVGNASLNYAYTQNLRLMMTKNNPNTFSSWNASLSGSLTQNALVSNSIYDATGKQYNQTVNAERVPFNLNGSFMFNTPIIANRLHFNTSTNLGYQERVGYTSRVTDLNLDINNLPLGAESLTQSVNGSENLSLTFTHDVFEIGVRGNYSCGYTFNHLSGNRQLTMNWSGSGNVNVHLPYSINIATDISYNDRFGYSSFDQKEILWNASIDKTIKKKLTLALSLTDILRQRLNISQNIGDNYISYNKYNTLPSYFLFTVTYKISSFKGGASQDSMIQGRMRGNGGNRPAGAPAGMPAGAPPMMPGMMMGM